MSNTPISDVVADLDSHGIYDAAKVAEDLVAAGYTGPLPEGITHAEMRKAIEDRGLGGWLAPDDGTRHIAGHTVAAMVCSHLTGTQPGSQYFGRGTAYRADLAAIKAWEESR